MVLVTLKDDTQIIVDAKFLPPSQATWLALQRLKQVLLQSDNVKQVQELPGAF